MKKYSRVHEEIDLDAVAHNFEVMHAKLRPGTKMCAVVKADCYGHGAIPISRMIQGYDYIWGYACATPEEAMSLRRAGIVKPVILLGYAFEESYEDMIDYDIRACVFEKESALALSRVAQSVSHKAIIHLAVDTGMGRIGFPVSDESVRTIKEISEIPNIEIEGIFTHFARADEPSLKPAVEQYSRYTDFIRRLEDAGVHIPIHHVSNSAALMRYPEANEDMVRAGITIYGLLPSEDVREEMSGLKSVMRMISHVSYVKDLPAGCPISYGGTFVTTRPTKVATIPVGYADGYPRTLSNKGSVLIHGKRARILGRVCMDQFMVDVTGMDVKQGDEAVLIGTQGNETISAEEIGNLSGRFNYELVCDISKRVPRSYLHRNQIIEQVDYF